MVFSHLIQKSFDLLVAHHALLGDSVVLTEVVLETIKAGAHDDVILVFFLDRSHF